MTNNPTTNELIAMLERTPEPGPQGESMRRGAALALGTSTDPAAAPAILTVLRAEMPGCGVHEDLTWATVQHIDETLPDVLAMLTDDDPAIRRTGAHVLSKVADPTHLDALIPLVADDDVDVALKAYRAVAHTGEGQADKALRALAGRLGDGDALQRDALTTALAGFGADAVPALVEALASDDRAVREHAVDALGHLGTEADAAATDLAKVATDEDADLRLAAVSALGQLGEPADVPLAELAASDDPVVAKVAQRFTAARA